MVGLTGGIGSGKSTVAALFGAHGAALVDTDAIAHRLTGSGGAAMPVLRAAFGEDIATTEGALDRVRMRERVFADASLRRQLEDLLHPLIRETARRQIDAAFAAGAPYVVLAVPLLVEAGDWASRCDRVLLVDCPVELQRRRVIARSGLSGEQVDRIIAAQATREARRAVAHDVIDNDGDETALAAAVSRLHTRYMALAGSEKPG